MIIVYYLALTFILFRVCLAESISFCFDMATPHKDCALDAKSDFSSNFIEMVQERISI